ncbi:hypothetical protein [uncultured Brachyspira sp.]|uniref:hypothetical protein n=1 Tax=uncultured Brachyspira sp. TaxID=221953 RepID=UPI0025D8C7B1|nr:hypothetical protein [uncultured Brachyspira sp.]
MGKVKNVFTMAVLYLIRNLLNFSLRLLPVFIIILALLKLSKVLIDLNWYLVLSILLLEVILIIFSVVFNSMFFKNKKDSDDASNLSEDINNNTKQASLNNNFSVLNIASLFFAFLGIIFVILKLFNAVAWSWIWVLSPLWLSAALVLFVLIICLIVFIISIFSKKNIGEISGSDSQSLNNNYEKSTDIYNKEQ